MSEYAVMPLADYVAACDALREKLGASESIVSGDLAEKIRSIPTGGVTPSGTLKIEQNGTFDVTSYASAWVAVPERSAGGEFNTLVKSASGVAGLSLSAEEIALIDSSGENNKRFGYIFISDGTVENAYGFDGAMNTATVDGELCAVFTGVTVIAGLSLYASPEVVVITFRPDGTTHIDYSKDKTVTDPPAYFSGAAKLTVYLPASGVWTGTQAEYDALSGYDSGVTYYITGGAG